MRRTIEFTIARDRHELLDLKNKENIHIVISRFRLPDILKVLQRNPRLQRIQISQSCYNKMMSDDNDLNYPYPPKQIMTLLEIRGIELIPRNITRKKNTTV